MHCRFYREVAGLLGRKRPGGEDIFGRRWPWCRGDLSELTVLMLLLVVLVLLLFGEPLRGELDIVCIVRGLLVDIVRLGGDAAR